MALSIIQLFEDKNPSYPSMYGEMIQKISTWQGDNQNVEKRNRQGKAFSNGYEVFMYAAILGLTRDEPMRTVGLEKGRFNVQMKKWNPVEMVRYLLMSIIVKDNIDLLALESMAEEDVKEQVNNLTNLLEQYACGGFSIMQNAIQQNPDYYRQEDFFLQLLM